ncbi:MAG: amidohydrolase family protein [Gemmatimonadota bacterium]
MRAVLLALISLSSAAAARAQAPIVIRNVSVIDGTGAPARSSLSVLIRNGKIERVEPAVTFRAPPGSRVLDGTGKWLIPGLIDMHAHVNLGPVHVVAGKPVTETDTSVTSWSLRMLLAFGVTTIRDPAAPAAAAVAVRDSVARGQLVGPRIFTAGELIDASEFPGLVEPARTADEVRAAVRRQAAVGVDYIKLYASLSPELVKAGIDEAHGLGKKVIGHLFATSWTQAADMGIDFIEHSFPSSPRLLPLERRAAFLKNIARNGRFMIQWHEYYDPKSAEADSMIRSLVAHRVVHTPTLVLFEAMAWGDSARVIANQDLRFAPPSLLENWKTEFTLSRDFTEADYASAKQAWPAVLRFVKQLYDRGVFLVAGTDAVGPWVPPGTSLHRELELLVSAGIPPLAVLEIATRNAAEALGILDQVGTVEPGKRADLVLLDADPSAVIANTRRISWVMKDGRLWEPRRLIQGKP